MDEDVMEETFWIVASKTGQKIARMTPEGGEFKPRLSDLAEGSHDFRLSDQDSRWSGMWLTITAKWKRMIVAEVNGVPKYAGYIINSSYSWTTKKLTLEHQDFHAMLDRRTTMGEDGYSTINFHE